MTCFFVVGILCLLKMPLSSSVQSLQEFSLCGSDTATTYTGLSPKVIIPFMSLQQRLYIKFVL